MPLRRLVLLAATTQALLLDPDTYNAPIVFSLDASPKLADHAFSAIASLSSVAHASKNASSLRFAFISTACQAGAANAGVQAPFERIRRMLRSRDAPTHIQGGKEASGERY